MPLFTTDIMRCWYLYILLLIAVLPAAGQDFPNLKFNQLTAKDGLSTNAVKYIFIDNRGIVWVATSNGLNRYDGTGFVVYNHNDDDSTSICNDAVSVIAADPEHQLWLGTNNGLSRFNPATGKSVNYFHESGNKNSLATSEKCAPFFDSKGRLWLATWAGVQQFDYKKKVFTTYTAPPVTGPDPQHFYNTFNIIREDASHRLWALSPFGLYRIDERQKKLVLYDQHSQKLNTAFHQFGSGEIYVGQPGDGVKHFSPQNGTYQTVTPMLFQKPDVKINDIGEWKDNAGNNWMFIAASDGFVLKDMKSNRVKEYVSDLMNPASLKAFTVYNIAKDNQNRLWLATDNGINIIDPNLQNFENFPLYQQLNLINPKLFGLPNNMLATDDRFYLTGYYAKGVYVFDKNWHLVQHLLQLPEHSKSELSKSVNSIYQDDRKNLWFSTDSGLVKQSGNKTRIYFPPNPDPADKNNLAVSKIYKRTDGLFWIRARQNGIFLFDPVKGVFLKQYKPDAKHIDGTVFSCFLDKKGILWVGATKGISRYIPSADNFEKIIIKDASGKEIPVSWITDINEDNDNTIWAVSDMGLLKVDKATNTGTLLTTKSGLPENYLKRLMIDSTGNLWIPSQRGIVKYDRKKKFTFFNINNGLPVQYEGHGFFEPDKEGNFLLGFSGYVTRFNPYNVKTNTEKPNVILIDIKIDGKETEPEKRGNGNRITLNAGTKILNIHFAITNYTAPQENDYYYKLGANASWQLVKNGDIALGSLPNGRYNLYLKGCNNDGVFSNEETVSILALPHWYETLWFKLLSLIGVIALITLLVRRRIKRIRTQSAFKQKLVESELKAIRAQMNPHFIFNVLNSIESYVVENDAKSASLMIQKFAGLCRLVLESSTQSFVTADREWKAIKLYTELEAVRFNNQFAFQFSYDESIDMQKLMVPPMLFQPLIENAIHHGLRNYLNTDGLVSIQLLRRNEKVVFIVTDNGIGLNATKNQKINHLLKQKSLAIKGIQERIAAINTSTGTIAASFKIRELTENGQSGTVAELTLPSIMR